KRIAAPANRDLARGQRVGGEARARADVLRDQRLAIELLGQVLEPRRDVDGIAERGEHDVVLVADVADDDLAPVDADAEADGLAEVSREFGVQMLDVGRDRTDRRERLAARKLGSAVEAEEREHTIAEKLVRLSAVRLDSPGYGRHEAIDQEHRVEWEAS